MSVVIEVAPRKSARDRGGTGGPDLLAIPLVRRVLLSRSMPLALQVFGLFTFAFAIYEGFFGSQVAEENFATIGVWALFFWPVILLSFVFLGRAWCAVCPVGTLTAAAGRWSRGIPFPKALRNTSLSLFFFVPIVWIIRPVLGISESPNATAWFLVAWGVLAVAVGLLYAPTRAFCRYLCPLTGPLSVLGRVAPVALRAGSDRRLSPSCAGCKAHECYNGSSAVGGCPMGEYPAAMDSNASCIFCLKCLKSCSAPERSAASPLQIRLRWPFLELSEVRKPQVLDALVIVSLMGVFLWHMAIGHGTRTPAFLVGWSKAASAALPSVPSEDVTYIVTFAFALAGIAGVLALAAVATSRLARLRFGRAYAAISYPFAALVVVRALGYLAQDVLAKSGDWLNYLASLVGIYTYYPSAAFGSISQPLMANTGYHLQGALLTAPLLLGLPLACYLAYRQWRRVAGTSRRALLLSLPAMLAMALIVGVYEWAYLVGYRVIV